MEKQRDVAKALAAGMQAFREEVASWLPLPKGMPAVGQRIRFVAPHPSAGHCGLVTEHKPYPVRQESLPVVLLDNGLTAVVRTARDWEAAGPLP